MRIWEALVWSLAALGVVGYLYLLATLVAQAAKQWGELGAVRLSARIKAGASAPQTPARHEKAHARAYQEYRAEHGRAPVSRVVTSRALSSLPGRGSRGR